MSQEAWIPCKFLAWAWVKQEIIGQENLARKISPSKAMEQLRRLSLRTWDYPLLSVVSLWPKMGFVWAWQRMWTSSQLAQNGAWDAFTFSGYCECRIFISKTIISAPIFCCTKSAFAYKIILQDSGKKFIFGGLGLLHILESTHMLWTTRIQHHSLKKPYVAKTCLFYLVKSISFRKRVARALSWINIWEAMQSIRIGNPGATRICKSQTFLSNVKYTQVWVWVWVYIKHFCTDGGSSERLI